MNAPQAAVIAAIARRSALVQGRDHLPAAREVVLRRQQRRHRRLSRPDARSSTTSPSSASTRSGCCRSIPRRGCDDGYDIADYRAVHPEYGTLDDVKRFIAAAHARGIRVITELVINHTSDQHPWFQRARQRQARLAGARLLRLVRHRPEIRRHAHHLPRHRALELDLGPGRRRLLLAPLLFAPARPQFRQSRACSKAVLGVMRFWLDSGVDGLRLDAVPYLIEREGTNNENLPETHDVLKRIRAELDSHYPGRMLLAEANQWPEDTKDYFGEGDECHMAFHFPLMPRMYMAIAREDRFPITDIMRQTPQIPDNCQWAIFLRNHDELTLEMVTDSRARLSVADLRRRPARAHQSRHPPPPRAAARARPPPHRADELPAALHARHAGDLLRRRDRHGRQHPSRRPRRRAHADAMVARPQWRLLARRSGGAGAAAHHGPALRLRGDQCRGADARPAFAAALDAPHAGDPPPATPRSAAAALRFLYPKNRKVLAYLRELRGRDDPVRRQRLAHAAGGRARSVGIRRPRAGRADRRLAVPADRPAHLPADPAALRLLLVRPGQRERAARLAHAGARADAGLRHRSCCATGSPMRSKPPTAPRSSASAAGLPAEAPLVRRQGPEHQVGARIAYTCRLPAATANMLLAEIEVKTDGDASRWLLPLSIVLGRRAGRRRCRRQLALARVRRGRRIGLLTDAFSLPAFARQMLAALGATARGSNAGRPIVFEPAPRRARIAAPAEPTRPCCG